MQHRAWSMGRPARRDGRDKERGQGQRRHAEQGDITQRIGWPAGCVEAGSKESTVVGSEITTLKRAPAPMTCLMGRRRGKAPMCSKFRHRCLQMRRLHRTDLGAWGGPRPSIADGHGPNEGVNGPGAPVGRGRRCRGYENACLHCADGKRNRCWLRDAENFKDFNEHRYCAAADTEKSGKQADQDARRQKHAPDGKGIGCEQPRHANSPSVDIACALSYEQTPGQMNDRSGAMIGT